MFPVMHVHYIPYYINKLNHFDYSCVLVHGTRHSIIQIIYDISKIKHTIY